MPSPTVLPDPDPDAIRRTAEEVLQRPEYQLDPPPATNQALIDLLLRFFRLILRPFEWLFDSMEGVPDALRWLIVVALAIILVALIAHIVYSISVAIRPVARRRGVVADPTTPDLKPTDFEQLAQEAAAGSDFIGAIRWLFKAALAGLQARENRRFRPGLTNREVLLRYRQAPFIDDMRLFVETIDAGWYGRQLCGDGEYRRCRDAYQQIRRHAQAPARAAAREAADA